MVFNSLQVKFHSAVLLMGRGMMQSWMVWRQDRWCRWLQGWCDWGTLKDGRCRTDDAVALWMAGLRTYGTEGGPQMVQHEDKRWYLAQAEDERQEKVTRWVGVEGGRGKVYFRRIVMVNTDNSHDLSPIGSQVGWFVVISPNYNSWLTAKGSLLARLLT